MAMPNLDPRKGGACLKFISKKLFSLIVGCVQVVLWVLSFFTLICKPSLAGGDTGAVAVTALILILNITFCVLLVLGVYHDRRLYVKIYLIYVIVYIVMVIFGVIVMLILQPASFIAIFFSVLITILLHLLFYFIVRCYYLMKYRNNGPNHNANQQITNPSRA